MLIRSLTHRSAPRREVCSDNSWVTAPTSRPEYDPRRFLPPDSGSVSHTDLSAITTTAPAALPVIQLIDSTRWLWLAPQRRQNLSRSICAALQTWQCLNPVVSAVSGANITYPFFVNVDLLTSNDLCPFVTGRFSFALVPRTMPNESRENITRSSGFSLPLKLDFVHFVTPAQAPASQNGQSRA